jgi:FKBP-type peptidyl-prolyl cis-trans isomerase
MTRFLLTASAAAVLLAACGETPDASEPAPSDASSAEAGSAVEGPDLETIRAESDPEVRMALLEARANALQAEMRARFEEHLSPLQAEMQALAGAMEEAQAELAAAAAADAAPIVAEARACEGGDPSAPDFTPPQPDEGMDPAEANSMITQALMLAADNTECVYALGTGLRFRIDRAQGEDMPVADPGEMVRVHYEGRLPDGTVFDSSYERGEPTQFPSDGVIQGWVQALAHMRVGEQWTLFIPADIGYGPQGRGPIGPNEAMIFKVELLALPGRPDAPVYEPEAAEESEG